MRIALFTDSFIPGVGGTEQAVFRQATALMQDHEVMVLAPRAGKNFNDSVFVFKVARAKSIQVTGNDYWAMPWASKKMKRALDEFKPEVVHIHTVGMMAGYGNKYARKHNIPSVSTLHTNFRQCYIEAFKSKFLAEVMIKTVMRRVKQADRVCTVSEYMAGQMRSYGIKNDITVVKNGNDTEVCPKERKERQDSIFNIIYVGRIVEYKNLRFSLKVIQELKKRRTDFKFRLVGGGPDFKKFNKLAKKIGVEDKVEFLGVVSDKQKLKELYADSDLFLFTSLIDSDGLVVMEAAAERTPSLVIANTGISERITDLQTGFVVENDINAVVDKLCGLMEDRKILESVGDKAHEMFCSWLDTANRYVEIYKEEIEKKIKTER